jgi:WD40 repeat protein
MYTPHTAPISGIATHQNFIATAGYDNDITLWDHRAGKPIARGRHDHLANHCAFSPDGSLLVSASSDHTARVWEIPSMRLRAVLCGHQDDVVKALFSPDGSRIATCSYDATLKVFDLNGQELATCRGHSGLIESFDWNSDGSKLISCGTDGSIRTWNVHDGRQAHIRDGLEFDVDALAMIDTQRFLVGCDNGEVWSLHGDAVQRYPAHKSGVKRLVLSDDRSLLLSLGYDQQLILWELFENGLRMVRTTQYPANVWARSAAFLNNDEAVFGTFGSKYAHWRQSTDQWTSDDFVPSRSLNAVCVDGPAVYAIGDAGILQQNGQSLTGPGTLCNCLASDGKHLWTAGQLGVIYNARTGAACYQVGKPVNCVTRLGNAPGSRMAFGTYGGSVLVFDSSPDLKHVATIQLDCNAIKGLTSLNGDIVCGSADGSLAIIDGESLTVRQLTRGAHDGILNGLTVYRDGFATISRDLTLRLWSTQAGLQQKIPSRHKFSIKCIASSSNGRLIATGSYGGTVDVFDCDAGQWRGGLQRPTMSGISSLAWNESQGEFLAASYDGAVHGIPIEA